MTPSPRCDDDEALLHRSGIGFVAEGGGARAAWPSGSPAFRSQSQRVIYLFQWVRAFRRAFSDRGFRSTACRSAGALRGPARQNVAVAARIVPLAPKTSVIMARIRTGGRGNWRTGAAAHATIGARLKSEPPLARK